MQQLTLSPFSRGSTIAHDRQLFVATERPQPDAMQPVSNSDSLINKPAGGLWTAPERSEGTSSWVAHLENGGNSLRRDGDAVYALEPASDADVVEIDSTDDLLALLDEYRRDDTLYNRHDRAPIDFEALAADYDGLALTADGLTANSTLRPHMDSWEVESIVWFDWVFDDVAHVRDL